METNIKKMKNLFFIPGKKFWTGVAPAGPHWAYSWGGHSCWWWANPNGSCEILILFGGDNLPSAAGMGGWGGPLEKSIAPRRRSENGNWWCGGGGYMSSIPTGWWPRGPGLGMEWSMPGLDDEPALSPFRPFPAAEAAANECFLFLPRFFPSILFPDVAPGESTEGARRRDDFPPGFASGLIIHQLDFPVPSFCTRTKRLCKDRLWRIEFWKEEKSFN